jgi:SAM-dependent methyltransferase
MLPIFDRAYQSARRFRRKFLPFFDYRFQDPHRYRMDLHAEELATVLPTGSLVLDAGAGECRLRPLFRDHRYVSCDLGVGDSTWNYRGLDCVCTLDTLPFRSRTFDGILLAEVLEHLAWPARSIQELGRVLRPGGLLYLSTPFMFPLHQIPHDYARHTRYGIEQMLVSAGFEVVRIDELGGILTSIYYYSRWLFDLPVCFFPSLKSRPFLLQLWGLSQMLVRHPIGWLAEKLDPLVWSILKRRMAGPLVIGYYAVSRRLEGE